MENQLTEKVMGVDPGDARIGIAISDASKSLARPLMILGHLSKRQNAARIVEIASSQGAGVIVIGQSQDDQGEPTAQGRKAARLAETISSMSTLRIVLWDEFQSSIQARERASIYPDRRRKKDRPIDDIAATIMLQDYLDHQHDPAGRTS